MPGNLVLTDTCRSLISYMIRNTNDKMGDLYWNSVFKIFELSEFRQVTQPSVSSLEKQCRQYLFYRVVKIKSDNTCNRLCTVAGIQKTLMYGSYYKLGYFHAAFHVYMEGENKQRSIIVWLSRFSLQSKKSIQIQASLLGVWFF